MNSIYTSAAGAEEVRSRYRTALDAWPVPSDHLLVPTSEGETFVVASGPIGAPPLVLLHGSGSNAATWRADISTWATKFRVYAIDLLGEPGGSAESRPDLKTGAVASWLDEVLGELSLTTTSMVGMSLGGWVALDYAIRRPGRIEQIALLCPGGIGRQKFGWLPAAILLRALGSHGRRRTARMVTGLDRPEMASILDDVVLTFAHFRPRTERLPVFSDEDLRSLSIPMLVIVGDGDVMMDSAETARRVQDHVPDATVSILDGVGHAIVGQTDTVMRFLAS